jgi:hypothetical protein
MLCQQLAAAISETEEIISKHNLLGSRIPVCVHKLHRCAKTKILLMCTYSLRRISPSSLELKWKNTSEQLMPLDLHKESMQHIA